MLEVSVFIMVDSNNNKKELTPFQQEKIKNIQDKIKSGTESDNKVQEINQELDIDKKTSPRIETPIGTEITQEDIDRAGTSGQSQEPRKETKFGKNLNAILVETSDDRLGKITDALKKNFLKLEKVKNDGSGIEVENKIYIPLTIGQNKKVMKIMKRARLLREDILGMGQDGGLGTGDLQKKYPDILDEDITQDELNNEDILNELIGNYVVAEKARIYWGIDDINNYVLSDLILIIGLYERRNNFTPT